MVHVNVERRDQLGPKVTSPYILYLHLCHNGPADAKHNSAVPYRRGESSTVAEFIF